MPARGVIHGDAPLDLTQYRPAQNPSVFSPQGGLRMSLADMLSFAVSLRAAPVDWHPDISAGDTLGGTVQGYGWGQQTFDGAAFYQGRLTGHFASAYGFRGGVWKDLDTGTAFAYALNGAAMDDEDDGFSPEELAIFAKAATT